MLWKITTFLILVHDLVRAREARQQLVDVAAAHVRQPPGHLGQRQVQRHHLVRTASRYLSSSCT